MGKINVYGKITRVSELEDGHVLIEGIVATENEVKGLIIPADVMREALPGYLEYPTVREMHQSWAAGRTVAAEVGEDGCTRIAAKIVDAEAKAKVREGVYTAFSIGGDIVEREAGNKKRIKKLDLYEISVVDSPADRNVERFTILNIRGDDMAAKKKAEKMIEQPKTKPVTAPEKTEAIARVAEITTTELPASGEITATAPVVATPDHKAEHRESLKRMNGAEIWDCKTALEALSIISALLSLEGNEDHPEAATQLADLQAAIEHLKAFIASEIMETEPGAGSIQTMTAAKEAGDDSIERVKFTKEHRNKMAAHDAALNQCREALRHCHEAFRAWGVEKDDDKGADKKDDKKADDKDKDKAEQVAAPIVNPVERVTTPIADDRLVALERRMTAAEEAAGKAGEALARVMGERDTLVDEFKKAEAELAKKGIVRVIAVEKQNDGAPVVEQLEEPKTARDAIRRVYQAGGASLIPR